jgi:hypothetical protein
VDRDIEEDIACDGEWMCVYVRSRYRDTSSPVDQAGYERVAEHCDGRYGCIEAFFEDWPRALPPPSTTDTGLRFADLLDRDPPRPAPSRGEIGFGAPRRSDAGTSRTTEHAAFSGSVRDESAPATDLGSVLADRRAREVSSARARLSETASALQDACRCTFAGDGCYTLPSESLLERAHAAERDRQRICLEGQTLAATPIRDDPTVIDGNRERLDTMRASLSRIDQDMDRAVRAWERARDEQIAQAKREADARSDRAFFAGVLTATAGAVAGHYTGGMTGEQAGYLGARVARQIEAGGSAAGAISSGLGQIQSSVGTGSVDPIGSTGSGAYSLSCFDHSNGMCGDYSFPDARKRDVFASRCRALGSEVLAGACDRSGAIGCRATAGATTSITWDYGTDRNQFRNNCRSSGGEILGGG